MYTTSQWVYNVSLLSHYPNTTIYTDTSSQHTRPNSQHFSMAAKHKLTPHNYVQQSQTSSPETSKLCDSWNSLTHMGITLDKMTITMATSTYPMVLILIAINDIVNWSKEACSFGTFFNCHIRKLHSAVITEITGHIGPFIWWHFIFNKWNLTPMVWTPWLTWRDRFNGTMWS